jgi:hypothetical protein
VSEQEKAQNNVNFTSSLLEKEGSVTSAVGAAMMYESASTFVSNTGEKLTATEEKEEDLGQKAKRAENAFQDLFTTAIDKGKLIASEKAKKLAAINFYITASNAAKDSADIAALGPMVEDLARAFEGVMTGIELELYNKQTYLLSGYEKLLQGQISVIDSKIHYVKRLKK